MMKAILVAVAILAVAVPTGFFLLSFDTQYAAGYSERAFKSIKVGDTQERVMSLLGAPISSRDSEPLVQWVYSDQKQPRFSQTGETSGTFTTLTFKKGALDNIVGQRRTSENSFVAGPGAGYVKLTPQQVEGLKGASPELVRKKFGAPTAVHDYKVTKVLSYSRSPSSSNYRLRMIGLDDEGKVVRIWKSVYWD